MTGLPGQDDQTELREQGCQHRTVRRGQPGQNRKERTAQKGEDSQKKRQTEQDS
jgi:hypothetical protein